MDTYTEQALQIGIEQVWGDLQREIKKPLAIWRRGTLMWPLYEGVSRLSIHSIPRFSCDEYYYSRQAKRLYFHYGREIQNLVEMSGVEEGEIPFLCSAMKVRREAMELFDLIAVEADDINEGFHQKMIGKLISSSARIQEIFGLQGIELSHSQKYAILLGRTANASSSGAARLAKEILSAEARLGWTGPVLWDERLIFVLPGEEKLAEIEDWIDGWQRALLARQAGQFVWGLGNAYGLKDLHKSYLEASLVWGYGLNRGLPFCALKQMGIEQMLFSQDIVTLRRYVSKTFGKLWQNDREERQMLFPTLRKLLESNFNFVQTAGQLFLHVNTIRYRYEKIEKLLEASLASPQVRGNLMVALLLWEVLEAAGLLERGVDSELS
ncbi:MAG: helix-turn-helix domain-containing protein [Selenomonas sp.]|nr:helix-turn-helix domain-containing protein [Selenomonas sp.]